MSLTEYFKFISDEERQKILDYSLKVSPSLRMAIWILDGLGVRANEALSLKTTDIDIENKKATINAIKQKKKIIRIIPDQLLLKIKTQIKQFYDIIKRCDGYLCFAYGHGAKANHISYNHLAWFFNRFRHAYGYTQPYNIRIDGKNQFRISSHTFRSYWITRFIKKCNKLNMGCEAIRLAQQEIGHTKIETTIHYLRFANREELVTKIIN